jgi:hypothetical protein
MLGDVMVNKMTVISEAEARVHSQGAVHVKFVRDNFFCKYFGIPL